MTLPFDQNTSLTAAQEYNQSTSFLDPIMTQRVLPSPNSSEDGAIGVNAPTYQQHFASASPMSVRGGSTPTAMRSTTTDLFQSFTQYPSRQIPDGSGVRTMIHSVPTPANHSVQELHQNQGAQIELARLQALTVADYATFSAEATQAHAQLRTLGYFPSALAARPNLLAAQQSKECDRRSYIRLTTLLEAIDNQDTIFLFIHQITCLAFLDVRHLPRQLQILPNIRNVLNHLTHLFSEISNMSLPQLRFCSNFPQALPNSAQPQLLQAFNPCLHAFVAVHDALTDSGLGFLEKAKIAELPPTAVALWTWLGSGSPTLMSTQFQSLAQSAWSRLPLSEPEYVALLSRAAQIHKKDRNGMLHRLQHELNSRTLSEAESLARAEMLTLNANLRASLASRSVSSSIVTPCNAATTATSVLRSQNVSNRRISSPNEGLQPKSTMRPLSMPRSTSLNTPDYFFRHPPFEGLPAMPRPQAALHQTHLASPPPSSKQSSPSNLESGIPAETLYQVIEDFVLAPISLTAGKIIQNFAFDLSADAVASLYKDNVDEHGESQRHYEAGKRQLRIKMSNRPFAKGKTIDHHEWVIADTYWPSCVLIEVNRQSVGLRRKVHFAKDLPSDLTTSVGKEFKYLKQGKNVVEVFLNTDHTDPQISKWSIAVEIIETKSLAVLKADRRKNVIPASVTELQITQRLCGNSGTDQEDGDDDFQFVGGDLTLKLFEPFTNNQIFTVPVRSKHCQHLDCFDLDIFLENRPRKGPGHPSNTDDWRCPLCRVDARPQNLIVDGFLVEVRKQLEATNKLDTMQISVKSDGKTWEPKPDASLARRTGKTIDLKRGTETLSARNTPMEVITIDDSD